MNLDWVDSCEPWIVVVENVFLSNLEPFHFRSESRWRAENLLKELKTGEMARLPYFVHIEHESMIIGNQMKKSNSSDEKTREYLLSASDTINKPQRHLSKRSIIDINVPLQIFFD